ncbi:MAG: hypothetical protein ACKPFK_21295, partial [Dolichospermum sp.]
PGSQLSIIDNNQNKLTLSIELPPSDEKIPDEFKELQFKVSLTPKLENETFILPLSSNGGLPVFHIRKFRTNAKPTTKNTIYYIIIFKNRSNDRLI